MAAGMTSLLHKHAFAAAATREVLADETIDKVKVVDQPTDH